MTFEPICQDLLISSRTMIGKRGGCVLYSPKYGNYLIKIVTLSANIDCSPSPLSISWYKYHDRTFDIMSTELLSPSQDFSSQAAEEVQIVENLQQEIDCPRCSDSMTLTSDFDGLFYFCQECQLSLVMK